MLVRGLRAWVFILVDELLVFLDDLRGANELFELDIGAWIYRRKLIGILLLLLR